MALPIGSITAFAGKNSTVPPDWMLCDGRELSISEYQSLFNIVGFTYSRSNCSLKFNIPNLNGRVVVGNNRSSRLGSKGGKDYINLDETHLPSHSHTGSVLNAGGHNHLGSLVLNGGQHSHSVIDPGHTHTQTTVNDDFNNSGGSNPSFAADSAGVKVWSNISTNQTGISLTSAGEHSHNLSITQDGIHSHTLVLDTAGSNAPVDIRTPFIRLSYIIKIM